MQKGEELELKTLITEEQFNKLLSLYPNLKFETQINHYFYSNDMSHYAFRIREKNGEKLFTLKQKNEDKVIEYEKIFEGRLEDDKEILNTLKQFDMFPPFKEIAILTTQRAMYINQYAELCFDINNYNGITDYEIEYEVKKPHDHLNSFKKILSQADIEYTPSWGSKYKRCIDSLI